jgi:hypothetical protein
MRSDIAKVICEDARRGSRDDSKMTARFKAAFKPAHDVDDRHEDYADLDCLPKQAGMRRHVNVYYGGGKEFSENLGALRGLIVKNVGKNWDKIYSALCQLVKPNGINVHRHVHQHLSDFIHIETKIVDGQVCCHGMIYRGDRALDWFPLKEYATSQYRRSDNNYFYYVDPKTRCIARWKFPKEKHREPKAETFIRNDDGVFVKINGIWWKLKIVENYLTPVRSWLGTAWGTRMVPMYQNMTVIARGEDGKESRVDVGTYIGEYLHYRGNVLGDKNAVAIGKRQLNGKELKTLSLTNDEAKEPIWKKTKSGWKNIA